ncbi:MAG: endonuclease MutS2 [Anaerolineae bacterium]|nr:MAG: endonuclease MutS2 [Anaerolineae bacterium]
MDEKTLKTLEYDKILGQLAEYTSFSAGEALVHQLTPTSDVDQAIEWQAQTTEARVLFDSRSDVSIGGARDIRRWVDNAMLGFVLQPDEFLEIQATIIAGRDLRRKLIKSADSLPNLASIAELMEECPGIVSRINAVLDERGEIVDSASETLAHIRQQLQIIRGRIQDKLRSLLVSNQNQYLQELTISLRGGRYVVPLMANHKGRIKGIVHDQSNSGATLWIEPFNTVDLNNEYRFLQIAEEEEIQRILAELSVLVADQGDALKRLVERIAEFDLIFAKARYAEVNQAIQPTFVDWAPMTGNRPAADSDSAALAELHPGSRIWIRGARHPLLDPNSTVPTDLLIDEGTYVVLITGPNTGGKTVSLKTVGLMVLMAQSGMHLPALEAKLTVFEQVFADIGDEQSIEQNLSTFSGHMTNIVRILRSVDDRSLVLLDELGSGTDPSEGAALAQAIVGYLRDKGATTFVATHYPELKSYASNTPGVINASLLFDVETLMPTYEMSIGMPGRSNALAIARRLGLEQTVLDDALTFLGSGSSKAESLLDAIYEMKEKIASQEAAARLTLKQADEYRIQLNNRLDKIEDERRVIINDTQQQIESELEDLRAEISVVRKKLRDTESRNQLKKLKKVADEIESEGFTRLNKLEPIDSKPQKKRKRRIQDFRIGDKVYITTLGAKGLIVDIDDKEAELSIGRLRMRARLEDLEFRGRDSDEQQESASTKVVTSAHSPGLELDMRGMRVEEGITLLENYLDSAFLSSMPWVRIIHGKGTGRLRSAVRHSLKGNSHVLSWEEGRDGEGGAGVTVVKLDTE